MGSSGYSGTRNGRTASGSLARSTNSAAPVRKKNPQNTGAVYSTIVANPLRATAPSAIRTSVKPPSASIAATGARARTIPAIGLEPDGERVWTYREALVPKAAPKSLIVIGSGAIGIEFASFYADLGAKVTVVEMLDRVVPVEDAEVSDFSPSSSRSRA